jgi:glycosyltransferase involved in cell wall biosynthesis
MDDAKLPRGVSVIICTRNGGKTIADVLTGLAACSVDCLHEVILVDNGSTDGVAQSAERHWKEIGAPCSLRVLYEPRPGKSFAFFTGVAEAQFDLVVICDDDNVLAPDYLSRSVELMRDRSIGGLGGAGGLRTDGEPPPHFFNFAPWFAVGAQLQSPEHANAEAVDLTRLYPERALWGAGLVLRRSDLLALTRVKGFPCIDGKLKCEDIELSHAIALIGRRLIYTPRLRFTHLISLSRLQPYKIIERFEYDRVASEFISCYVQLRKNGLETRWRTLTRFGWRALRAFVTSASVRPLMFGALAQCGLSWLMRPSERRVYEIVRQLQDIGPTLLAA